MRTPPPTHALAGRRPALTRPPPPAPPRSYNHHVRGPRFWQQSASFLFVCKLGLTKLAPPNPQPPAGQFVIYDSTGVPLSRVAAGDSWPAPVTSPAYADTLASGRSFASGPCDNIKFHHGGGAEWRGVQAQQPFDAAAPGAAAPASGWVMDSAQSAWGLNLHVIDLRLVDTCGAWQGNLCACAINRQQPSPPPPPTPLAG